MPIVAGPGGAGADITFIDPTTGEVMLRREVKSIVGEAQGTFNREISQASKQVEYNGEIHVQVEAGRDAQELIDRFRGSRPPETMDKYKGVQIKIVDPEGNVLYDGPLAAKTEMPDSGGVDLDSIKALPGEYQEAVELLGKDPNRTKGFWANEDYVNKYYENLEKKEIDYKTLITDFVNNNEYGINTPEAHAIFGYTTILFYERLNRLLRDNTNPDMTAPLTDLLINGLEKLPKISGEAQYRGINLSEEVLQDYLGKHQPNEIVTYGEFLSAAKYPIQPFWNQANVRLTITPSNARDITDLAFGVHFLEQLSQGKIKNDTHESLFMPNSQFRVNKVYPKEELREILDKQTGKTTEELITVYYILLTQLK